MAKARLNRLQMRTLALLQELAKKSETASQNEETGEISLFALPHPHGDHVHIGRYTVSTRFASGLNNPNALSSLENKGMIRLPGANIITLTTQGLSYHTGIEEQILRKSDH